MSNYKISILHLYPDLLNLYGDKGNIECMRKRLEWRGIEVQVITFMADSEPDFSNADIVFLGGGNDREQKLYARS
jgi:CobQ-like glutamine amidotransferase family enzyme